MLFHVHMAVEFPYDLPQETREQLKRDEKALAQSLQRSGKWRHLWRIVGVYENFSVFDVADNTELHDLLVQLPLYPYMTVKVQPLCRHPSSIHEDDR